MKRVLTWLLSTLTVVVLLFGYKTSTGGSVGDIPAAISAAPTSDSSSSDSSSSGSSGGSGSSDSTSSGSTDGASSGSSGTAADGSAGDSSGSSSNSSGSSSGSSSGASGTVTGDVAQTRWGPVQVAVSVGSGKVSDVQVVEYPTENPRDQEINSYALPILIKETIASQSANIDMVSGATVTSDGYIQSLQSALDRAGL